MTGHTWDPDRYLGFADERARPFFDLVGRVGAVDPEVVVDLGCGTGNLTARLSQRWPGASVVGVDTSASMLSRAVPGPRLRFEQGDLRTWSPERPVDVVVSHATLQWVPGHLDLLPDLVGALVPGGWLALQVPGNFDAPSHALRRELAAEPRFAAHLEGIAAPQAWGPEVYLAGLQDLGCTVDAWETTYLHVLPGKDAVLEWVLGTGARPTVEALPAGLREEFVEELRSRLRTAYPAGRSGTVLPFRRVFAVARSASGPVAGRGDGSGLGTAAGGDHLS